MSSLSSTTVWLERLKAGDADAAQRLWEGYYPRLVRLARARLAGAPRLPGDEEDIALSAFASFCRGAEEGRFPQLADGDGLWHLLVTITARKAANAIRDERRKKRGGGMVRGESAIPVVAGADGEPGLMQVVGSEPTPEFAAQVAEECERLFGLLRDEKVCSLAVLTVEDTRARRVPNVWTAPRRG